MNFRNAASAITLLAALLGGATMARAADYAQEKTNLIHFHLIDFVGWNNANMDVLRTYHRPEVAVDMGGAHTEGMEAHAEMLTKSLEGGSKIIQHTPSVAQGEWTAVVGLTTQGSMATIGHWKDGALIAEMLFLRPLTADDIAKVDVSKPIATITTPDDQALRAATGAEPGWSAVMVKDAAIFTQTIDGKVVKQLGYAPL